MLADLTGCLPYMTHSQTKTVAKLQVIYSIFSLLYLTCDWLMLGGIFFLQSYNSLLQWLTSIISLQTSIAQHLAQKQLSGSKRPVASVQPLRSDTPSPTPSNGQ